ncbi:DUF5615 family PIN-like protein [Algoriphagus sp. D3-2-R+10]|uniref:DUF5615 family PIN-like protein n=1 Tax=Algoriphagus aurantiacus TaxID=3103948 RepID=UPI002B3821B9|nr:DUF5615 family PIN-like protein [Algoriphagus sp. D3-2-R+10]MEB2777271.1 DUF5615 family PIN-like protein [Algoriphagus sp. D3-2-R+10]
MKLLFDQNISYRIVKNLSDIYPEAKQVRELGIEGFTDREIWEFAKSGDFIIVTFDADFYHFSLVWNHPPKIIWIRSIVQTTPVIESLLRKHLRDIELFKVDSTLSCLELIGKQ